MKSITMHARAFLLGGLFMQSIPTICMDTALSEPIRSTFSSVQHTVSQPQSHGEVLYNLTKKHPQLTGVLLQASVSSACAFINLVSSDEHIEMFSDHGLPVRPQLKIQIQTLLHEHGVTNPTSWQVMRMNRYAAQQTHVPYILVTRSVIFIDEDGFEELKRNPIYHHEYKALCAYIAQQALLSSYLKTSGSTSLGHGATWAAVSGVMYAVMNGVSSVFGQTAVLTSLDSLSNQDYIGWPVWILTLCVSNYLYGQVYSKVQGYIQPYLKKPFEAYKAHSLFALDKAVVSKLGDEPEGAIHLLTILRDSMEEDDSRLDLTRQRIEALSKL
jgi:hypothetical protein